MSQYDIVFHTDSECDQSELSNSFSQPGHPIYKQAIENAQSQASSYEQFLSQLTGAQIYTGHVDYNQGSFPVSPGYCQLPTQSPSSLPTTAVNEPSAQSWTDLFPELFPQSFWSIEDQRRWDELIRWEMAQPGYPVHPGRIFGSNHLGWNLQATSASHDVVPISSDNHHQSGGLLGTVGYWNPVEEKVTLKGWKYEAATQYLYVPALIVTQPEGYVEVLVPPSLKPTPRSAYNGDDIWWWIEEWLNMPVPEEEASMDEMNESLVVEASDCGSRKRKRED